MTVLVRNRRGADYEAIRHSPVGIGSIPMAALRMHKWLRRTPPGRVVKVIEKSGAFAALDYDIDAMDFNRSYFLRNAVKCGALLDLFSDALPKVVRREVVDVGGGVGTFAMMASRVWPEANFEIFDRSPRQLALGKLMALPGRGSVGSKWTSDLNAVAKTRQPAVCLFSYSLCETQALFADFLDMDADAALVVDYPAVIEECSEIFSRYNGFSRIVRAEILLDFPLSQLLGQPTVVINGGLFVRGR